MRTSKGLALAKELLGQNKSITMLALEISDILEYRNSGMQDWLKESDNFLLGLMYSEFYATGNSDEDYAKASMKRDEFLKVLNIDFMDLYRATEKIYGRTVTE